MTSHLADPNQPTTSEEMLDALERDAFGYFLHETNPANGLVVDKTQPDAPASIAAVGFALAAYPVGVERSWMTRAEAVERTRAVLRFFWTSPQGTAADATGYKGYEPKRRSANKWRELRLKRRRTRREWKERKREMQNSAQSLLMRAFVGMLTFAYRPVVRRAARQALEGRLLDPERPERGRWLRRDVHGYIGDVWKRVADLVPMANLDALPTYGNRHNVFLAVVTTAAYQVLVERGVQQSYASSLISDVGWKIYAWMLSVVALPFRLTTRDSQKRMQRILKALMVFPFSAPGAPGYEVRASSEGDHFFTHWTHCPPHAFVRRLAEGGADNGELDAFYRSWCLYDWAAADLLAGNGTHGHYARPHTMSKGDPVCDMCWWGGSARAFVDRVDREEAKNGTGSVRSLPARQPASVNGTAVRERR